MVRLRLQGATAGAVPRACCAALALALVLALALALARAEASEARGVVYDSDGTPIFQPILANHAKCPAGLKCDPSKGNLVQGDGGQCSCECRGSWTGRECTQCALGTDDCMHGGRLSAGSCSCRCKAPWTGPNCNVCGRKSTDKCSVNPDTCRCSCQGPWGGDNCDVCLRSEAHCAPPSRLNPKTCECEECPGASGGSAPFCGTCPLTSCKNYGCLDPSTCTCECAGPFTGLDCGECSRRQEDCQHGGTLSPTQCACTGCKGLWVGDLCDKCALDDGSCFHNGVVDKAACTCERCDGPWGGQLCDVCSLEPADCGHGGSVCKHSCKCTDCDAPWTGPRCLDCALQADECVHGSLDSAPGACACKCEAPWKGLRCDTCGLRPEVCGKGTRLDAGRCQCVPAAEDAGVQRQETLSDAAGQIEKAMVSGGIDPKLIQELPMLDKSTTAFLEARRSRRSTRQQQQQHLLRRAAASQKKMMRADRRYLQLQSPQAAPNADDKRGTLISCSWTGLPDDLGAFVGTEAYYGRTRTGYLQHLFVASECSGGKLPDPRLGTWMATLHSTYNCGKPEQWSIISPNEQDGPGIMWWNGKQCGEDGAARVRVDFYLPPADAQKHLHRCVWQGSAERIVRPNPAAPDTSDPSGTKHLLMKPWWPSVAEGHVSPLAEPGTIDGDSGGTTNKYQRPEDARFWADKDGADWTPAAPGYHRHAFEAADCSNGLPPLSGERCLTSFRWGESCGCDGDWAVLHGNVSTPESAASVEWYTGQECDHARVAADFFCPTSLADQDFKTALHTCTYQGPGVVRPCDAGGLRSPNSMTEEGQCRSHTFTAAECLNGLPAQRVGNPDRDCLATVREFIQCGTALDLDIKVEEKGTTVEWYTPLFSAARAGADGTCGDARIVVDVFCPGVCSKECKNGGKLDLSACQCKCRRPYTGDQCEVCALEPTDCEHGTQLDLLQCKCVSSDDTWTGLVGDVCNRDDSDCKHGGVMDRDTCACARCDEPWTGDDCGTCGRDQKKCLQGSRLNPDTCDCDIDCPTWGPTCDRCPKGLADLECSGRGACNGKGKCNCPASKYAGDACELTVRKADCSVSGSGEIFTFDLAGATWSGTGEVVALRQKIPNSDLYQSVHLFFSKAYDKTAVSAVAVRIGGPTGEQIMVSARSSDETALADKPDGMVSIDCDDVVAPGATAAPKVLRATSQGSIKIKTTSAGYEVKTAHDLTVDISGWSGTGEDGEERGFFDVAISVRAAPDGSLAGACANYDGDADNDFEGQSGADFVACQVVSQRQSHFMCVGPANDRIRNRLTDAPSMGGAQCRSAPSGSPRFRSRSTSSGSDASRFASSKAALATSSTAADDLSGESLAKANRCSDQDWSKAVAHCQQFEPKDFPAGFRRSSKRLRPLQKCYREFCSPSGSPGNAICKAGQLHMVQERNNIEDSLLEAALDSLSARRAAAARASSAAADGETAASC